MEVSPHNQLARAMKIIVKTSRGTCYTKLIFLHLVQFVGKLCVLVRPKREMVIHYFYALVGLIRVPREVCWNMLRKLKNTPSTLTHA
jgi:hypothetical protein